jgi:uncharacterized protein YgfB (UPF0149 family)
MLYQDINQIIAKIDADCSAAESHGIATGMLCVNSHTEFGFWLGELSQEASALNDADKAALQDLFEQTRSLLASDEFEFDLLLPNEDTSLNEQIEALRQWCQGFLFGLGATASASVTSATWPQEVREAVKDIAEFTKLDTDAEGEEAENDFMEITEYLRAAVIFVQSELNAVDDRTVH